MNEIAAPDRTSDNSTYWEKDFNRQHYMDMFFNGMADQGGESFKQIYQEMSSGRYTVDGDEITFEGERYLVLERSWRAGRVITTDRADTIADGIAVREVLDRICAQLALSWSRDEDYGGVRAIAGTIRNYLGF